MQPKEMFVAGSEFQFIFFKFFFLKPFYCFVPCDIAALNVVVVNAALRRVPRTESTNVSLSLHSGSMPSTEICAC